MTQGMAGKPLLQGKGAGGAGRMAQQPGPAAGETGAALAAGREEGLMAGTEEARQAVFAANEMGGASPETSAANSGREAAHAQRVTGQPGFAKGEMPGANPARAGAASVGPETSAANFGRKEDARQAARRTARAAMRIWAARTRRVREGWPGQEAVLCPECGRALAGGSPLYVRRGTGACLGCARDVDRHTPFLPVCPVCMGALGAGGPGEVPLYTAHGCDFVLGCGHCVAVREAGWPGQLEEEAGGC